MKYGHFTLLPERAFTKVGGQIKPQGGGSGGSSAPTSQSVTSTSIPEYARPYAESMLGQTSALTNINNNPYQPYQGQQVASFSPLQNQGFASLADMQIAPQIAMGTDIAKRASEGAMSTAPTALGYGAQGSLAGQAGQEIGTTGGLGYGSQAAGLAGANIGIGQQGMQAGMGYGQGAQNAGTVQGYMNPYLQASLQPQLAEMQRQYGISGAQGQSNATKAGAFGGSREALIFAENQRNKNIAMNQAIGQGYNTAYDVANKNMQAAAALGMQGAGVGLAGLSGANQNYATGLQGVNTALAGTAQGMQGAQTGLQGVSGAQNAYGLGIQGANTLGSLGTAQYNQQMGIAQAQLGAGAQQQQYAQQQLNIPYQQYQEQLNYPYKQLAFQSDMMRGLPLSQSAQTIYQNTGSMVPQVLGAGIAAYGASAGRGAKEGGLMSYARGGAVQGYAMGGQPAVDPRAMAATSPAALPSKLAQLSDGQLQAYARTVKDAVALAEVKAEMARRSNVRQPQGEEPTQTVAESIAGQGGIAEQPVMAAAGGGIVALAGGSEEATKEKTELQESLASRQSEVERRNLENELLKEARHLDSFYGGALGSTRQRNEARTLIQDLQGAPTDALRSFRASGVTPKQQQVQNQYGVDAQGRTSTAGTAEAVAAGNRDLLNADVDSQVQPSEALQYPNTFRQTLEDVNEGQQMQDADSQVQPYGGITAIPRAAGTPVATGAPASGGIIPAGGVPTGGVPTGGIIPAGGDTPTIGNVPPAAIGKGAVPVGNSNDMSWGAFAANVKAASQLEPEDKALLADMQARADRRMKRAEGQEKNVMSEALISGGLAMMSGLNLSDGVRKMAEAGGKQYFASQSEARKAINAAEDAQDAFNQYQMSYKQGNKKMVGELYSKWQSSMLDFQGKIQAAGISAGAQDRSTQENIKARELAQANTLADRQLARDQQMQIHQQNVQIHKDDFAAKMAQTQNIQAQTLMSGYESRLSGIQEGARKTAADLNSRFAKQREELQFSADKPEVKAAKVRALELKQAVELKAALDPYVDRQAGVLAQQDNLMNRVLGFGTSGANESGSAGRVVGVRSNP